MALKKIKKVICLSTLLLCFGSTVIAQQKKQIVKTNKVWSPEKANQWYSTHPWLSGADYIPSTAINQLEMWQANTFDPETIDKEFGFAEGIGFNTMRVFLHSLAWKQDPAGFKKRMNIFLSISEKHHIQPLFVFFDDCWNATPAAGKQPAPKKGIHNSGWVQDPGQPASWDTANFPELEKYVKDILASFKHDKRILLWDLYNEPGNSEKGNKTLPLLVKIFSWAKEINPDQPISSGLWNLSLQELNKFQVSHSDVITYHDYNPVEEHLKLVQLLKLFGRPLICTEYMARPRNSRFETVMVMLKKENVGAINWGFVSGKTNTIYAWDTPIPDGSEPKEWFHDIFRPNGEPYNHNETDLIKKLNGKQGIAAGSTADPTNISGAWRIGVQMWTFHYVSFVEALDKADSAGIKYIEAFPGQPLGGGMNETFGIGMSADSKAKIKEILQSKGISIVAMGIIVPKSLAEWKQYFDLAREFGLSYITAEPLKDQWDGIDSLAGVYGIRVAIHDHPRPDPYWHPDSVLAAAQGHPNIGSCADVGHWARSGLDPVECLKKLEGHIIGVHLKDIDMAGHIDANDLVVGTGVIRFPEIFAELKRQRFNGLFSIERESNWYNNVPDVSATIKYFHEQVAKLP